MALPFPVPSHLAPAFSMSRCTTADVDAIAKIYYEAFETDPRNGFWWSPDKAAMYAWMKRRILRKMADRSTRHFKVTDAQSGKLVAFARWDIPEGYGAVFGEPTEADPEPVDVSQTVAAGEGAEGVPQGGENAPVTTAPVDVITPPKTDIPDGAPPDLCQIFFDALSNMSEKQNAKTMLGLSLLCTSPAYFGKGAAKALMFPMLNLADAHGLKTYLEATPGGKPVYEKLGFKEVDELVFDLKKLTGKFEDVYKLSIMVREPNSIS
ncbi:acyl-CoA N-acyltransferase [Hypoxylon sp. FL0543]|nr:acyl-CoA N-acyltransferase [Hypoxylon sp. FL0543]